MKKTYTTFFFLLLCALSIHAQRLGSMQHVVNPKGEVTMAGKTKGTVTKEELLKSDSLQLKDQFTPGFNIYRFRMVWVSKEKGKRFEFENVSGPELTPEMSEAIKHSKEGDKIFFERIVCKDKNDSLYGSEPIALKLKFSPVPDSTQAKAAGEEAVTHDTGQTH